VPEVKNVERDASSQGSTPKTVFDGEDVIDADAVTTTGAGHAEFVANITAAGDAFKATNTTANDAVDLVKTNERSGQMAYPDDVSGEAKSKGANEQFQPMLPVEKEERELTSQAFQLNAGESISRTTAVGNFTAVRLVTEKLEGSPANMTINGPHGEELSLSVPASAFKELGEDVVVIAGTIQPEVILDTLENSLELGTPVVSIKISNNSNSQSFAAVSNLQEPILIRLSPRSPAPDSQGRVPKCAWLNENLNRVSLWQQVWSPLSLLSYEQHMGLMNMWYGEGLTRIDDENSFTCATTHLTVFAGIYGDLADELADTIKCSNAAVLSAQGLQRMSESSEWIMSPAALFLWGLVLFHMLLISVGMHFDVRASRRGLWGDEHFLVDDPDLSDPPRGTLWEKVKSKLADARARAAEVPCLRNLPCARSQSTRRNNGKGAKHQKEEGWATVVANKQGIDNDKDGKDDEKNQAQLPDSGTVGISQKIEQKFTDSVKGCLLKVIAVKDHVCANDLQTSIDRLKEERLTEISGDQLELEWRSKTQGTDRDLEAGFCSGPQRTVSLTKVSGGTNIGGHFVLRRNSTLKFDEDQIVQDRVLKAFDEFNQRNFFVRVGIIFAADQPWLAFSRLNTRGTGSFAALVLAAHLLITFALDALFFTVEGVHDAKSDPECNPKDFWERAYRSVAVGFVSAILGEIPKLILLKLKLGSRSFMYFPQDDVAGRQRQLKKWKALDVGAWAWGICLCAVSVFFVAAFIANVGRDASSQWLVSSATSLVKTAVIDPIVTALLVVLMTTIYRWNNPGHDIVKDHFFGAAKSPQNVPAGTGLPGSLASPPDNLPTLLTSCSMVGSGSKSLKKLANQEQADEDKLPGAVSFIAKTPRNHMSSEDVMGFAGSHDELALEEGPQTPHNTNVEDARSSSIWPFGRFALNMPAVHSSPQSENSTDQVNVVSEEKPAVACIAGSQKASTTTSTRATFGGFTQSWSADSLQEDAIRQGQTSSKVLRHSLSSLSTDSGVNTDDEVAKSFRKSLSSLSSLS